jgi:hypothetical protein
MGAVNYALFKSRWWHVLPRWFGRVYDYLRLGHHAVDRICRATVSPVMRVETTSAKFTGWVRALTGRGEQSSLRRQG